MHFWGPHRHHQQHPDHDSSPSSPPPLTTANTPSNTSKPSLILIHGFGPHGVWQWRQQIVFFAANFDIYVPDLVFFGHSTSKSTERSEVFQAASVGKLLEMLGVKSYSVVGTSYGGFVAYNMALMFPERVHKLVIASSGVNMRKKDHAELLRRANVEKTEQLMLPESPKQLRTLMKLAVHRNPYLPNFMLKDFIERLYAENRKEKMELLHGLTIGTDETQSLKPLQQDVLIVWGEHDCIFPLDKGRELKEILGEKARLEVMKNTAHVPQIEQGAIFNSIVKEFLA